MSSISMPAAKAASAAARALAMLKRALPSKVIGTWRACTSGMRSVERYRHSVSWRSMTAPRPPAETCVLKRSFCGSSEK